jgi:hypothetical protein
MEARGGKRGRGDFCRSCLLVEVEEALSLMSWLEFDAGPREEAEGDF